MSSTKLVYAVSSVGLGHAKRALLIARELKKKQADLELVWLAAPPVSQYLEAMGETMAPESHKMASLSEALEGESSDSAISDMARVVRKSATIARRNYGEIKGVVEDCDALVQDEFFETLLSPLWEDNPRLPVRKIYETDYIFLSSSSKRPLSLLTSWYANRALKKAVEAQRLNIFLDEKEGLSGAELEFAEPRFEFVGPVIEMAPRGSKDEIKKELGLDSGEKYLTVTVGGTSTGGRLLEIARQASGQILRELGLRTLILSGPRAAQSKEAQGGALELGFSTKSLALYKASECVVTQAGASTLHELSSIAAPAVIVPLSNHWEQRRNALRFSRLQGYQVLEPHKLNSQSLVQSVRLAISRRYEPRNYAPNSERAASLILSAISE